MKQLVPFYTDLDSRAEFFADLGTDFFLDKGDTFRHFKAIDLGLWHDMEAIYEDAADMIRHEIALADLGIPMPDWMWKSALVKKSQRLRQEIRDAIATKQAIADNAFRKDKRPVPGYSVPRNSALTDIYVEIIKEVMIEARFTIRAQMDEWKETCVDVEHALDISIRNEEYAL